MAGTYAPKMVGQKCLLAPLEPDDYRLFAQWVNDPEVAVNLSILSHTISIAQEKQILGSLAATGTTTRP